MLVQFRHDSLRLFRQHDHGLATGELARRWSSGWSQPGWLQVLLAASLHDVAWRHEDVSPRWNPETRQPYTFWDLPAPERYQIYADGLDLLEFVGPIAGLLCSRHYASFARGAGGEDFRRGEESRRRKIVRSAGLTATEVEALQPYFDFLQNVDLISLSLCLTPPGVMVSGLPDWIWRVPKCFGEQYTVRWASADRAVVDPFPFDGPFVLEHPCFDIEGIEFASPEDLARSWQDRTSGVFRVEITPLP
jgi:hypothetical protein